MSHFSNRSRCESAKLRYAAGTSAVRKARLELEALEDRLVPSGNVYVEKDAEHNIHIQGTYGNEALEIKYHVDGPLSGAVTIAPLDANTTIHATTYLEAWPAGNGFVLAWARLAGNVEIELGGGADRVRLAGNTPPMLAARPLVIAGDLSVTGAKVDIDLVEVRGATELTIDPEESIPTPNRITRSSFREDFELEADFGISLEVDAVSFQDATFDTWRYGENRLSFQDIHVFGDLTIDTDDADPAERDNSALTAYTLDLTRMRVYGETEITTGAAATVNIHDNDDADPSSNLNHFADDGFDGDFCLTVPEDALTISMIGTDFLSDLDIDVQGTIFGAFHMQEVHVSDDTGIDLEGMVEQLLVSQSRFSEDFLVDMTGCENQIDELIIEDSDFNDETNIEVRANGGPFMSQGAPLVHVRDSEFADLTLTMSDQHDDVVWLDGVVLDGNDGEAWLTINLLDGDDAIHFANSTIADYDAEITFNGGDGNDSWFDDGGNIYDTNDDGQGDGDFREILHEDSISELPSTTTSPSQGLTIAPVDATGARVVALNASRKAVRLTFSESIDARSFTVADVSASSNGAPLALAGVTAVPGSDDRMFDIRFLTPASAGLSLSLGVNILDLAGNRLNQDRDAVNGELVADVYRWKDTAGPRVTGITHAPGRIRVHFDQAVDPASFSVADVRLTDLIDRPVQVLDVHHSAWNGGKVFDLMVGSYPVGGYKLTVGPSVTDLLGNWMNQDNDAVNGEKGVDAYVAMHKDTLAPLVSLVHGEWYGATVSFSEAIAPATFSTGLVRLRHATTGSLANVSAVEMAPSSDGLRFHIFADAAPGAYRLEIDPGVRDLFGNQMLKRYGATIQIDAPFAANPTQALADLTAMLRDDRLAALLEGPLLDWLATGMLWPEEGEPLTLPADFLPPQLETNPVPWLESLTPSLRSELYELAMDAALERMDALDMVYAERDSLVFAGRGF